MTVSAMVSAFLTVGSFSGHERTVNQSSGRVCLPASTNAAYRRVVSG